MLVAAMISLVLQDQVGDATSDPSDLFSGVGSAFTIALLLAIACVAIAITWRNYRGLLKRSVRRRRHRRHSHHRPTLDAALLAPAVRKPDAAVAAASAPAELRANPSSPDVPAASRELTAGP